MATRDRAVIYARCSSQKQADRDLSVPAQLDACRQYVQRQGWVLVGEYHDDGISGFEDERRPEFSRMLADAESRPRPFDVIVVWDLSRFSRSLEHSLRAGNELKSVGVRLESIKEQLDDTSAGWLMGTVFRSFNEFQVRKLAEDTRRGMRKNAAEGGWNGGTVPIGYRVERDENGRGPRRLVPDPTRAPLVERIFQMALVGKGAGSIAGVLNEEGLRTTRGRRWSKQSVIYVLRNEVYAGVYTWGTRSSAKFATATLEPHRRENAHPALVSPEDFARVQAAIRIRRPTITHPKTTAGEYLLSGLLRCGACGSPFIGHGAKSGKYHYYTCQKKMKQGAKACPEATNFERRRVEGVVIDALSEGALHPAVFAELVREVQGSLRALQQAAVGERVVLEGQLAEVERRLTNLYEAIESGKIPVDRLAPRIDKVCGEKDELEARLTELPSPDNELLLEITDEAIETWVGDLRAVVERGTAEEKRGLLRAWIKRIVAHGDELSVEYTFPLVGVAGPVEPGGGAPPSGGLPPASRLRVNSHRRRKGGNGSGPSRKGEPAMRRVLPTVLNGSPPRSRGQRPADDAFRRGQ